jgi:hypothetical protein
MPLKFQKKVRILRVISSNKLSQERARAALMAYRYYKQDKSFSWQDALEKAAAETNFTASSLGHAWYTAFPEGHLLQKRRLAISDSRRNCENHGRAENIKWGKVRSTIRQEILRIFEENENIRSVIEAAKILQDTDPRFAQLQAKSIAIMFSEEIAGTDAQEHMKNLRRIRPGKMQLTVDRMALIGELGMAHTIIEASEIIARLSEIYAQDDKSRIKAAAARSYWSTLRTEDQLEQSGFTYVNSGQNLQRPELPESARDVIDELISRAESHSKAVTFDELVKAFGCSEEQLEAHLQSTLEYSVEHSTAIAAE